MREETTGIHSEPALFAPTNAGVSDDFALGADPTSPVAIPKVVVAKIWDQAREGIRSLKVGGLEVGGLLVGRKVSAERAVVEEIVPMPIEYRTGPSFQMSPADLATIAPAIESAHRGSKLVLGFYRSRTRGDEGLRASDQVILEAIQKAHGSYPDDFRCCLILAPKSLTRAVACLVLRDANGWTESQPVPLQSNQVPTLAGSPSVSLEPVRRADEKAVHAAVSPSTSVSEPPIQKNRAISFLPLRFRIPEQRIWLYAAAGLIGAAFVLATIVELWPRRSPTPQAVPAAHLGFSAASEGQRWKLTWDRVAVDTLGPLGGVLSIDDGAFNQQVPLALPDLASGALFYTARSENLKFSLRIDRAGSHVEEHVNVIAGPNMESGAEPVRRPDRKEIPPVSASRNAENGWTQSRKPVQVTVATLARSPLPPAATGLDFPPASSPAVAGRDGAGRAAPVAARMPSAPLPSQLSEALPDYVGPRAIQQPRPQLPANMSSGLEASVSVEIDTQGKVIKVIPMGWRPVDAPLVEWAVRAVSAWVFEPAKLDGKAVPSQMDLIFRS